MNCKETKAAIDIQSRRAPSGDTIKSHLNGCPDCHRYADETSALLMLLSAQPRVQAPADFDFRLRARIARAQSAERHPLGLLENLWARTFSWGQAATAMAALAVAVTFSTYYFNHHNQPSATAGDGGNIALTMEPQSPVGSVAKPDQNHIQAGATQAQKSAPAKFTRSSKSAAAGFQPAQVNLASTDNSTRFYNVARRQVVSTPNRNVVIGVEDAGLAKQAVVALTF